MSTLILENAAVVGATGDRAVPGMNVLIENGTIREVSSKPIKSQSAANMDCRGLTLMPGMIDCHVHVIASNIQLAVNAMLPNSLVAARAATIMQGMLSGASPRCATSAAPIAGWCERSTKARSRVRGW